MVRSPVGAQLGDEANTPRGKAETPGGAPFHNEENVRLKCPKCDHAMDKVEFQNIEVDRCSYCAGMWFDLLEAEHLKSLEGSESIDIGDPKDGEHFDEIRRIDCPVCHTPMIRMVDRDQPHIRFESCKVCYGVYFDAGEFKDWKTKSLLDFFRDLIARPD